MRTTQEKTDEAVEALELALKFAFENGLHEFGYNPILPLLAHIDELEAIIEDVRGLICGACMSPHTGWVSREDLERVVLPRAKKEG